MIFVFSFFILFIGYVLSHFFNKIKLIDFKNYSKIEVCCFSFIFGIILFILFMFLYGLKFNYSRIMFIPLYLISLLGLVFFILDSKKNSFMTLNKKNTKKEKIMNIVLDIALVLFFVIFSIISLKSSLNTPDEFSLWGREAKAIYNMKTFLKLNESVGISYPLSMPLYYSGFYFFNGFEACNQIRLMSTIITLCFSIMFIERAKRKGYNSIFTKLLILFLLFMNTIMIEISTTLYVDIIIMLLYSMGFLYACDYINRESNKDNGIILFIIFNSFVTCIKPDGIYLSLISIITISLFFIFKKIFFKYKIKKDNIKLIIFSLISSVSCYIVYRFTFKLLTNNPLRYIAPDAADPKEIKLSYLNTSIDNGARQMLSNPSTIAFILILLLSVFLIIYYKIKINKKDLSTLFLCIICFIFNLMFLYLAFIYQFGGEGVLAPSIVRYMTRVSPLVIEIILILYVYLEGVKNEKSSSVDAKL